MFLTMTLCDNSNQLLHIDISIKWLDFKVNLHTIKRKLYINRILKNDWILLWKSIRALIINEPRLNKIIYTFEYNHATSKSYIFLSPSNLSSNTLKYKFNIISTLNKAQPENFLNADYAMFVIKFVKKCILIQYSFNSLCLLWCLISIYRWAQF